MRNANDTYRMLNPIRFSEYPWSKNDEVLFDIIDDLIIFLHLNRCLKKL